MPNKTPISVVMLRNYNGGKWECMFVRKDNEPKFYEANIHSALRLTRVMDRLAMWRKFFIIPLAVGWRAYSQGQAPNIPDDWWVDDVSFFHGGLEVQVKPDRTFKIVSHGLDSLVVIDELSLDEARWLSATLEGAVRAWLEVGG